MKIIIDRGLCNNDLSFCARCSAAFFRKPMGTDRPCVVDIVDDGKDDLLHFQIMTEGRVLEFDLTDDVREGLTTEGWEFLADFDPALIRRGAADRWRQLAKKPAAHATVA